MELLNESYSVFGSGGWESCMVVQDKLEEHGLCTCFRWELDPSGAHHDHRKWRFLFETYLGSDALIKLLGSDVTRYQVQLR